MQQNYAASPYVRENPSISYLEPGDAWLTQHLIGSIETLFGRKTIESIYQDLKSKPFELKSFFSDALAMAKIKADYDHKQLQKISGTDQIPHFQGNRYSKPVRLNIKSGSSV